MSAENTLGPNLTPTCTDTCSPTQAAHICHQLPQAVVVGVPVGPPSFPQQASQWLHCVLDHAHDPSISARGGLVGSVRGQHVQCNTTNGHQSWSLHSAASSMYITFTVSSPIRILRLDLMARCDGYTNTGVDVHFNQCQLTPPEGIRIVGQQYGNYSVALPNPLPSGDNILKMSLGQVSAHRHMQCKHNVACPNVLGPGAKHMLDYKLLRTTTGLLHTLGCGVSTQLLSEPY